MNYRIPIISSLMERREANREANLQRVKAETAFFRERTSALEDMKKVSSELSQAIIKTATTPVMSLETELYNDTKKPYASKIWQSNTDFARRQSRIAYWSSPEAQAMIGRFVDMVIGPRLELESMPVWDLIPGFEADTDESIKQKNKIVKNIESRYRLWAKSNYSDHIDEKNHYQRSRQNFESFLIDGEYFDVLRYSASRKRNPLTVQRIKPENVKRVSSTVTQGNTEFDGIEYNAKGAAVAYHIYDAKSGSSTRVPKYGPRSGKQLVIHNKLGDGRRGTGLLAGVISSITKIADFQALEIQAAVINAMFAVWVETAVGGENKPLIPKGGISGLSYKDEYKERPSVSEFSANINTTEFTNGGIIAQGLGEGQKLHSFDTQRPTASFEAFYKTVLRTLYSAKGMSYAVAMYDMNGSYSAARGELLVFWNRVMTLRFDHMTDYEDVIYKLWFWGEVENGNIIAPGFQDDSIRDAWTNAYWTGPARPDIDPARSAKAHEIEGKHAWKTDAEISAERSGSDWNENIERKTRENILKAAANEPLYKLEKTTYTESKTETESVTKTVEE